MSEKVNEKIRFSVITVTYNAVKVLEKTMQSVMEQQDADWEYIIIDGGSKDGTVDLIRKYESVISYWHSEPDRGLYDAMNKGLEKATGDYVWFLNAGDIFFDSRILSGLTNLLTDTVLPDILYGETAVVNDKYEVLGMRRLKTPEKLNWQSFKWGMLVCHQAFVVRRELAVFYDLQYRIAADFDWCIRCLKAAKILLNTRMTLVAFLEGGMSSQHRKNALQERYRIMCRYYGIWPTRFRHFWFAIRFYVVKLVKGRV